RVDDVVRFVDVDERRAEGVKIFGSGGPDPLFGEVVAFIFGGPENEVVLGRLVIDGFGGPGAAGVIGGDADEARLGPFHQISRFPDDDGFAAGVLSAAPVAVEVDGEIGGEEVELFPVVCAQEVGIAHAFFTERADENGFAAV